MRKTYRVLLGVGLAALVLLASCSQPGASSTPPSPAQAKTITANVIAAISAAFTASGAGTKAASGKGLASQDTTYSGSYSGNGYTVAYTATSYTAGGGTATVTITFSGYSYSGVTFSSGKAILAYTADAAGDFNFAYTGNFNITYNGTAYTFGWNLTANYTAATTSYTYSGTYTIDGQSYTYTG